VIQRKKFRSITYPQYGTAAHIKAGKLNMAKFGEFSVTGWRKMRGAKKTIALKSKDGHGWAIVMCPGARQGRMQDVAEDSKGPCTAWCRC
jgi:putative transposase